MDLNRLLSKLDPEHELEFSPSHIELTSSKEMFAYTAFLDDHIVIKDPLLLHYIDVDQTVLKKYNPYTSDVIFAVPHHAVALISPLSDEYLNYYKTALEGIYSVDSVESSGDATLH